LIINKGVVNEISKIIDYLIKQSAHPTGSVGKIFVLIWNKVYRNDLSS